MRGRHHKAEHVAAAGLEARTLAGAPEGGDDVAKVLHDVAVETERVVSHVVHVGFQESGVDDVDVQWLAKRALWRQRARGERRISSRKDTALVIKICKSLVSAANEKTKSERNATLETRRHVAVSPK